MSKYLLLAAAGAAALLAAAPTAYAQANPEDRVSELGEVVVVARRTEERLQEVPLSVTGITAEQLESRSITTGTDLQKLVPTLNVGVSIFGGAQQFSLRGVRSGVVSYFNEVPVNSTLADQQLWDLASVQAVSGPQGTLFGRNSTGGAVLFVPQKPTGDFGGYVEGRVGNYNLREMTAVLNLPAHELVQFRLGARITQRDGLVDNLSGPDLQEQDRTALRASALFQPLPWLNNYTVLSYARRDDTPYAQISGAGAPVGPCPVNTLSCVYGARYAAELNLQRQRGIRTVDIPLVPLQYDEPWQFTNILTADLGALTVKYIAGYQGGQSRQYTSQLSIPLPVIIGENNGDSRQTTHELQILGKSFDERLDWVAGLYSSQTKSTNGNYYLLFSPVGTPFSRLTTQQTGGVNKTDSKAVYAQGTLAITDQLNFTAGVRYTEDEPSTAQFGYSPGLRCNLPPLRSVNLVSCIQTIASKSDAVTYNLSVDYQATDDILLYATTRKGYNAGGFNANINDPNLEIIKPEFITDYEAGIKADWNLGSMPVRTNLSGFLAKYDDIQRTTSLIYNGLVVTGNFNAAKATIYGAQLEVLARPIDQLTVQGSYGYLHTKYDNFQNALIGNATGNKFAQAPEQTLNLSATYRHPLPTGELVANASYAYISEVTFADDNLTTPGNTADGYGLVDLRLDWKGIGDRKLDLGVYVKNATDEEYVLNTTDRTTPFGFTSRLYGDPRTYGIELKYAFGGN